MKKFLSVGSIKLNDYTANAENRFASKMISEFLDKKGRFVSDFLAENIGIRHYHIGYNKPTQDVLAFVRIVENSCYLLAIGSHKDIYIETGESVVEEAMRSEFPSDYERMFLKLNGILPGRENPTARDVALLKSSGITSIYSDCDGVVRFVGSGISTARTPGFVNRLASRARQELQSLACDFKSMFRANRRSLLSFEVLDNLPCLVLRDHVAEGFMCFGKVILDHRSALGEICFMIKGAYSAQGRVAPSIYSKLKGKVGQATSPVIFSRKF